MLLFGTLAGLVVLGSLVGLGIVVVHTWRHVVVLAHTVGEAGERIADATAGLEAASTRFEQRSS